MKTQPGASEQYHNHNWFFFFFIYWFELRIADVAGVVEQVGMTVTEYAVGDEVIAYDRRRDPGAGAIPNWSSRRCAPSPANPRRWTGGRPPGCRSPGSPRSQFARAAGVGKDDTVLVHAAAGGVGSFAVQIAVAHGARVIGTTGERNHDFLAHWGRSR